MIKMILNVLGHEYVDIQLAYAEFTQERLKQLLNMRELLQMVRSRDADISSFEASNLDLPSTAGAH